jgi:hypothetical protein
MSQIRNKSNHKQNTKKIIEWITRGTIKEKREKERNQGKK